MHVGQKLDNDWHGKGTRTDEDGSVWEGFWQGEKLNGPGRYYSADGYFYEGQFKNGLFHGQGKYIYSNGVTWEGEFCEDNKVQEKVLA